MITKEHFLKCLNIISNQYNMAEELNKIFHTYEKSDFLDGYGFINNEIINLLVETLDKSFNENCD